ncbi:MAG: hypothetical protein MZU95_08140 [Desulfomicrobium escambiense]|nr:hypothetical protein [Desulfomicrobium escambiense]
MVIVLSAFPTASPAIDAGPGGVLWDGRALRLRPDRQADRSVRRRRMASHHRRIDE